MICPCSGLLVCCVLTCRGTLTGSGSQSGCLCTDYRVLHAYLHARTHLSWISGREWMPEWVFLYICPWEVLHAYLHARTELPCVAHMPAHTHSPVMELWPEVDPGVDVFVRLSIGSLARIPARTHSPVMCCTHTYTHALTCRGTLAGSGSRSGCFYTSVRPKPYTHTCTHALTCHGTLGGSGSQSGCFCTFSRPTPYTGPWRNRTRLPLRQPCSLSSFRSLRWSRSFLKRYDGR